MVNYEDQDQDNAADESSAMHPAAQQNDSTTSTTHDKYNATRILFYLLGTMTLLPTNFISTANTYWMYKFRNVTQNFTADDLSQQNDTERTGLQAEFTSTFTIVSNISNVVFLALTIAVLAKRIPLMMRIMASLCGIIVMLLIFTIFVGVNTDTWQRGFYVLTLISASILSGFTAVTYVSVFQLAIRFPPIFLPCLLTGQAICGILAALVQIFALSIGAKSSGLVYFLIGLIFIAFTLVYVILMCLKSEYFVEHVNKLAPERAKVKFTKEVIFGVLHQIKYYLGSMIILLGASVLTHPAITALVVSVNKGHGNNFSDIYFTAVATFLLYNLFDYIGRELAAKFNQFQNGPIILALSVIRIAFIPLIIFCNAQPRHHLAVAFNSDALYMVFISLFAFAGGYLVNLCVIHVPGATRAEDQGIAMTLIVVTMIVSMGTLAFLSVLVIKAL